MEIQMILKKQGVGQLKYNLVDFLTNKPGGCVGTATGTSLSQSLVKE